MKRVEIGLDDTQDPGRINFSKEEEKMSNHKQTKRQESNSFWQHSFHM